MKSTLPLSTSELFQKRILPVAKIVIAALLMRGLQSARLFFNYSYWFFSVLIFLSCQRNLTQTESSVNGINIHNEYAVPTEKFISIDTLDATLVNKLAVPGHEVSVMIEDKVKRFYKANAFKTKWLEEHAPHALFFGVLEQLKNARQHGLHPADYDVNGIEENISLLYKTKPVHKTEIIRQDVHITKIFFLFTAHLREGRIAQPGDERNIWIRQKKEVDHSDVDLLVKATNIALLNNVIEKAQPAHEQYAKLKKALAHYRSFENDVFVITANGRIAPGERHDAIPIVRKKISFTDNDAIYSSAEGTDTLLYDTTLVEAIKSFQNRHGLEANGIIGDKTLKYLNQSFKEKADLIALNMERMRWLPDNYGEYYITVNIPEYKLRIIEHSRQTLEMKVIVGAVGSATPVFHDTLEQVVFSPTWTVPPGVMKNEIVPRLKKNPKYYAQKNFSFYKNGIMIDPANEKWDSTLNIHQYRVVQKPGADNALGLVKFVMPNNMHIYLHDTPDHSLFSKTFRAMSHGCIRLDDPAKLARYLLNEEKGWDGIAIRKAMNAFTPYTVWLKRQYPVYLQYNTVWVDDTDQVNFREDIYGHDKRHVRQLNPSKNIFSQSGVLVAAP